MTYTSTCSLCHLKYVILILCLQLFNHCLAANTYGDGTGCDNMTCVIIVLHQAGQSPLDGSSLAPIKRCVGDVEAPEENSEKRPRVEEEGAGSTSGWTKCGRKEITLWILSNIYSENNTWIELQIQCRNCEWMFCVCSCCMQLFFELQQWPKDWSFIILKTWMIKKMLGLVHLKHSFYWK